LPIASTGQSCAQIHKALSQGGGSGDNLPSHTENLENFGN